MHRSPGCPPITERYIHQALVAEQAAIAIEQFSAVRAQPSAIRRAHPCLLVRWRRRTVGSAHCRRSPCPPVVQLFPDARATLATLDISPTAVIDLACLGGDPAIGAHQAAIAVIQAIGVESQRPRLASSPPCCSRVPTVTCRSPFFAAMRPLGAAHLLGGQIQGALR